MANRNGYVKLYRSFLDWEWYDHLPTRVVFLHLLLSANFEEKEWHGIQIKRGEVVTSVRKLSQKCQTTLQQTRAALRNLSTTHEITQYPTSHYTLIHIESFEKWQGLSTHKEIVQDTLCNTQNTRIATTTKEIKKKEDIKKVEIKEKNIKKESFAIPPEIADAFEGFAEMRKKKGKALTDYSTKLILSKLQKLAGDDYSLQRQILDQSTLNSWQGVFPLKEDKPNGGAENGQAVNDAPKERKSFAAVVL